MDLGSRAYKELGTQVALQYLTMSSEADIIGTSWYTEHRIQVKRLVVGLMASCFGVLVCLTILVFVYRPRNTAPCDPEAISSQAAILAASRTLWQRFGQAGSATSNEVKGRILQDSYRTKTNRYKAFVIKKVSHSSHMPKTMARTRSKLTIEWWRPLTIQNWYMALLIAIPLALILVLEVLQQASYRHQGLLIVSPSGNLHIWATFLPALVMAGVAALYTSFDFNVSLLAPFAILKRGNASPTRSIMLNLLGKMPPHALFLAIRNGCKAACLTLLASFVSAFLTIVVSGLYSPAPALNLQNIVIKQIDNFNFTHVDLSLNDKFAGSITNLITYWNLSYPHWTFDNLVFPSMAMASPGLGSFNASQTATISATIPAFRGVLDCSLVLADYVSSISALGNTPSDCQGYDTTIDVIGGGIEDGTVQIKYSIDLPYRLCAGRVSNATKANWLQTYITPNDSTSVYNGIGTGLRWEWDSGVISGNGPEEASVDGVEDIFTPITDNVLPSCPSVSISLGTANAGLKTDKMIEHNCHVEWESQSNIDITYCYQRLERVMANVTFLYPGFIITDVIPLEDTTQNVSAPDTTLKDSEYWLDLSISSLLKSLQVNGVAMTGPNNLGSFMEALVWGKDGVSLEELYNPQNTTLLIAAANRLYGRYLAQALSQNMRSTIADPSQPLDIYNATFSYSTQRLQQNRLPKVVLQVMLAFMTLCALGVWVIFSKDVKEVLPHNPCSIAGTMSLLADSKLVREYIREGTEWDSGVALRHEKGWERMRLRMGWWDKEDEGVPVFGIDVEEDELVKRDERVARAR